MTNNHRTDDLTSFLPKAKKVWHAKDGIGTDLVATQIKELVERSLSGFTFKGGDSDYRGFHFDGKNDQGITFSIEQLGSVSEFINQCFQVDVWVCGENGVEVEQVFLKLLKILETGRPVITDSH